LDRCIRLLDQLRIHHSFFLCHVLPFHRLRLLLFHRRLSQHLLLYQTFYTSSFFYLFARIAESFQQVALEVRLTGIGQVKFLGQVGFVLWFLV
jgi:hypothetical protein